MTFTKGLSTNNYGPYKFIVSTNAANGTHTTLAAANAVASAGDTILLRDSVTENITLTAGVNIAGEGSGAANVPSITGKITVSGTGTSTISNVRLVTNSDNVIVMSGANSPVLYLLNCFIDATNNTAISNSAGSSFLWMYRCHIALGTTGITLCTFTAGTLNAFYCFLSNGSNSTTISAFSGSAACTLHHCRLNAGFSTADTASLTTSYCSFNMPNTLNMTLNGSGSTILKHSDFTSGTASAITIGASAIVTVVHCSVNSSNANTLTGAGQMYYAFISFLGGAGHNVTTETNLASLI